MRVFVILLISVLFCICVLGNNVSGITRIRIGDQTIWADSNMLQSFRRQNVVFSEIPDTNVENSFHNQTKKDLPAFVIATWGNENFQIATQNSWDVLIEKATVSNMSHVFDAMVSGCQILEMEKQVHNVGWNGSPDENGETTLDSVLMDGNTFNVGGVAGLRGIKEAMSVARLVLDHTGHNVLSGDLATKFAIEFGGKTEQDLSGDYSKQYQKNWEERDCQPNFWRDVSPDPTLTCGPYFPALSLNRTITLPGSSPGVTKENHDTVSMVIMDREGNLAAGSTTNGLGHKIAGRVGDTPIAGAGAFADSAVGGCGATGDGDVMARFLPCYQAVENMRLGMDPTSAAQDALTRIKKKYPDFNGALVTADNTGQTGAACLGYSSFSFCVVNEATGGKVDVRTVYPHL